MSLERRQLLSGTQAGFASTIGILGENGIGSVDLRLLPKAFHLPRGYAILDVSIAGATSSLLGKQPGARGRFLSFQGASVTGGPGQVLTAVGLGHLRLVVGAAGAAGGAFTVQVGLAGDVDGNYRIDGQDLALIGMGLGRRLGQAGYSVAADVNHDGRIGGVDLSLARRNLGVATTVRPLGVTVGLAPGTNLDGQGRVSGAGVTIVGQSQPFARLFLDQDVDGRIDAETRADAAGQYQFQIDLKQGVNGLVVSAVDSFWQLAGASTLIVRQDAPTDSKAPELVLDGPPPPSRTNQVPTLRGHVSDDDSGVQGVAVRVDQGSAIAVSFDGATGAFSFTPSGLADGPHLFKFTARDRAGNASAPVSVGFTLDTTPPVINAFGLSTGSQSAPGVTTSARVVLVGQTEPNSRLTLEETGEKTVSNNSGAFQFEDVAAVLGSNSFHVKAQDELGNAAIASTSFTRSNAVVSGNSVVYWNNVTLQAIVADNTNPPVASRNLAIVMGAVYDAVNAAQGQSGYFVTIAAPVGASLPAAVAGAAHEALAALYPAQAARFAAALSVSLADIPDDEARSRGLAIGRQVADAIYAQRVDDGSTANTLDLGSEIVGEWRPTLPNFDPGLKPSWGGVTPFVLASADQFVTPGPPDLTSDAYADAVNQVQQLGRIDSTTRTADQTEIAKFWADGVGTVTPVGHWNQIAQTVAAAESTSLDAQARLFAMLNIALADAAISTWNVKYSEDVWRPITAIAEADTDGNDGTVADPTWLPLLPTPAFPSYVSGHSTYSGAAAAVLGSVFGNSYAFTAASPSLSGVSREYASFEQAADEAGMSRIYGGIHYIFDDLDGLALGKNIGEFVAQSFDRQDTTAPRITVSSPVAGAVLGGNTTVIGTVNDAVSGVATLVVGVDGGPLATVAFDPLTGAFQFPTTFGIDGTHVLRFVATDHAGNTSAPLDRSVILDRVAPTIQLDSVSNWDVIDATTRLTGFAEPTGSSLVQLSYRIDDGPKRPISFDPATGEFNEPITLGALAAGSHTLALDAMDAGGNTAHANLTVILGAAAPSRLTSVQPADGSVDVGSTFRPRVVFSRPVDPSTLTAQNFFLSFGDRKLPATIVPAIDGTYAWLFPTTAMPGGATIRLTVDGSSIRTGEGLFLDAAGEGVAGSKFSALFKTVSTSGVPGTSISGIVADPGIDLHPMTRDDIKTGPDGLLNTPDDVYLNPLAGVTLYILGQEDRKVTTDAQGRFRLDDVPAGDVKLAIDGRTATNAPAGFYFPEMVMDLTIQPGVVNTVMGAMGDPKKASALADVPGLYLPRLETALLHTVSNATGMSIGVDPASAPNLTPEQQQHLHFDVPAGSLIGADGQPLPSAQIGISTVPTELVRDMLPAGILQHTFDITIQALGVATFATPVPLTVPNVYGAAPGSKFNLLSFDHTTGRLVIDGTMTVSADGQSATTDPGSGIIHPGWHGPDLGTKTEPCDPKEGGGTGPDPVVGKTTKDTLKSHFYIKDDESFTLKFKNEQTDPKGKRLEVEVKVDGPYQEFLKGLDSLVDKPFYLCPQDDKTFKISLKTLLDKVKDYDKDQFYGAKFHVTARPEGGGETLLDEEFFVYRLVDVADDNHNDGKAIPYAAHMNLLGIPVSQDQGQAGAENTLEFAPTIIGIERDREVEMHMPDDAKPKLEFTDDAFSEADGKFAFKPTDSLGSGETATKKGELVIKDPKDDKELGRVNLLGQATGKYQVAANLAGLEAALLQLANDWHATRNSNAQTPVHDQLLLESEIALFDTPGEAQAMAEQVFAKIQERYAPFSDMIEVVKSAGSGDAIHIDWFEVNEPIGGAAVDITKSFYGASEGDVGGPSENPLGPASVVQDRDRFNPSEQDFRYAKMINQIPAGLAHIYIGNHIEPFYKEGFPMTADAIASVLGNTAAHEVGHSLLGSGHLANVDGDSQSVSVEQQAITLAGDRAHARFRLGFLGVFTDWLPGNADPETVRTALNALPTIRDSIPSGIRAEDGEPFLAATPNGYRVVFGGLLTWKDVPNLVIQTEPNLTGVVSELIKGRFSDRPVTGDGASTDVMVGGTLDTVDVLRFLPGNTYERLLVALKGDWSHADAQAAIDQQARIVKLFGLGGNQAGDPPLSAYPTLADPKLNVLDAGLKSSMARLDFGTVTVDGPEGATASQQVLLLNLGDPDLVVRSIRILGDTSSFVIMSSLPTSIARAGSTPLEIRFDPQLGGTHTASLVIDTNDPNGPKTIALVGVGLSPRGDLRVSVANNNLGGQAVGAGPKIAGGFMTLQNIGAAPLTITDIQVPVGMGIFRVGGLPTGFGPGQPLVIAPGGSFPLEVDFTPDRAGLRPGVIDVLTDDPATPVFRQHVVGTGLQPGNFHPEQNYVAVQTPDIRGSFPLRERTSDDGYWSVVLPARTGYAYTIFDPISGLVGTTGGLSNADGVITDVGAPAFLASTAPDTDLDGLPDDVEFAIGTSPNRADSNEDGIDDFAAVMRGLNPSGSRPFPTGIIANLNIVGGVKDMKLAAPSDDPSKLYAYIIGDEGFTIVDVSRFDKPIVLGQTPLANSATSVAVDPANKIAIVVMGAIGVGIVDLSDSTRPVVTRTVTLPTAASLVEIHDGTAYLTSGGNLVVMDVVTGATYETITLTSTNFVTGLAREGTTLYTIDSARTLQVVDISGPAPVLRGSLTLGFGDGSIFVGGSVAYVQAVGLGFGTVDVSNPDQPQVIVSPHLPDDIRITGELALNGSGLAGMAGLAMIGTGIRPVFALLDVSDPAQTYNLLTSVPLTFATPAAVSIADGIAFVGTSTTLIGGAQPPGLLVINYRPFDAEGQAPTVSIESAIPTGTAITEGSRIPILVTTADDVQIARVELIVDGKVVATDASFPFDFVAYAATLNSGLTSTNIQVRATDTGGNSRLSNALIYDLTPDTVSPIVAASAPRDGGQVASATGVAVRLNEPIDASLVNASGVTLTRDGLPVSLKSVRASSSLGISIEANSSLPFGAYTLTIAPSIVADRAGNHVTVPVVIHFIVGTARVVGTSPTPGSTVDTSTTSISLAFNTAINPTIPTPADFHLVGAGPDLAFGTTDDVTVPIDALEFNPSNTQLTLGLAQALAPDSYRLTATAAALLDSFGRPLDGEFSGGPGSTNAFPSGDGLPGGDFLYTFSIARPSSLHFDSFPAQVFANFNTDALPSLSLGASFSPILAVDLNGDGLIDVVRTIQGRYFAGFDGQGHQVFADASQVGVLFGKPGGGFADAVAFDVAPKATRVVAGDINGDGKLDLLVLGNPGSSNSRQPFQLSVLLGTGTSFLPELRINPGLDSDQPGAMVLGDFTGDGKLDLAILIPGRVFQNPALPNRVALLNGIGDGTFSAPNLTDLPGTASEYQLLASDLDRDGKLDLVSSVHVLMNRGDGTFDLGALGQNPLAQDTLSAPGSFFAFADVDGDGSGDVVNLIPSPDGTAPTLVEVSLALPGGGFGATITAATLPADFGRGLAASDINGDGRADAVVWQLEPDSAGVNARLMFGQSNGTFGTPSVLIANMPFLPDLGIVDRNGDGKLDVISSLATLLGDGTGAFTAGQLDGGDTLVGLVDINNDQIPDAITTLRDSIQSPITGKTVVDSVRVRVLLGQGDGTFVGMASDIEVPIDGGFGGDRTGRFITGVLADFDGDGNLDLALGGASSEVGFQGGIAMLRGLGDGKFAAPTIFPLDDPFNRFQAVTIAAGDASGDGAPDLLIGLVNTNSGQPFSTSVLINAGDGTFHAPFANPGPVPTNETSIPPRLIADVNNDGELDLIRLSSDINQQATPTTIQIALGRGDGTFAPYSDGTPTPFPKGFGTGLSLGDVNGDGILDVLVWQAFTDGLGVSARLALGVGDGTFGTPTSVSFATNFLQHELADVDGDGHLDIVRLGAFANLVVNRGDGLGGFGPDIGSGQAQIGFSGTNFLLADVNGDGKLDAINPGNRAALGNGNGQFFAAPRPFSGIPAGSAALGDINGDGYLDVIGTSPNQIRIAYGASGGSFGDTIGIPVANLDGLGEVLAEDLDGDGLVDLIITGENVLTILLSNGDGSFQAPTQLNAPGLTRARSLPFPSVRARIADLNHDGLLDILAADTILLRKR